MRFGHQLQTSLNPDWRYYYVDYDGLKLRLKMRPGLSSSSYREGDEATFVQLLEHELDKVYDFHKLKFNEITRRVEYAETRTRTLEQSTTQDGETIDTEVHDITKEVNELQKYARLNYSAFLKIIKKHDKYTSYALRPVFMVRLAAKPFYRDSFEPLVLRLSRLYDRVRKPDKGSAGGSGSSQNFVRRTTKYWVHPDHVFELKMYILRYLPVLLFHDDEEGEEVDSSISSVYFDNRDLELYLGRLEKSENAEAIRFRWYGPASNNEIFVERKTHKEDWTGETSVKQRFPIKEKNVNAFARGDWTVDKMISKLRGSGTKSEADLKSLETLAHEIQESIRTKHLHPVMRTFYHRTAFQLPGDARVRISLDTELSMIREDDFDGTPRAGLNWRRKDVRTAYPFSNLPDSDICRFPYAVLEVKLQTAAGAEVPKWVENLVDSHLVEEVPKFSKFIHGCSTLLEPHVPLLPFWLPQMDKDIRREGAGGTLTGPGGVSTPTRELLSGPFSPKERAPSSRSVSRNLSQYGSVGGSGRAGEGRRGEDGRAGTEEDGNIEVVVDDSSGTRRGESEPLLGWGPSLLKRFWKRRGNQASSSSPSSPRRKRVAVPVRVEPKVFFANERTFLSWLHFAVVLGGLALGLMNFGDRSGMIAGAIFTLVAAGIMLYALLTYRWRSQRIRQRLPGPYDDQRGPVVLVGAIFAAVGVNFWLKFWDM
ncbi:MAG: VTC domain-containing protein [Piptocephalis tieghemiana]|nr:MAG: VTC domain-containing protein [Piptocephalis tieghemiana]